MTNTGTLVPADVAAKIEAAVGRWSSALISLSHSLHHEPEPAFEEYRSVAKIVDLAAGAGFDTKTGAGGLPTAFVATKGTGDLTLGFCAEYDALPGIGHACGHNVNGAAAVGAAIALADVADALDVRVKLVGTPAEEAGGGKALLLRAGVFDDVAAAMMVHAGGRDEVGGSSLAMSQWTAEYRGRSSHAATAPWLGANALDAVAVAYNAIGLLRQQLEPGVVVSIIVTDGGQACNVIPSNARVTAEIRATSTTALRQVQSRVRACLEAGALATGTDVTITPCGEDFAELRQDEFMTLAYSRALGTRGRTTLSRAGDHIASTDMGNVSQVLPVIHPTIGYDVGDAAHHTAEFASHGTSTSADDAVRDGAIAMALVGAELALDRHERTRLLERIHNLHHRRDETV
ncbi:MULTISPECIES: amidohydrolase [unclassified Rhodococcus (in: high G+C Gram-positive bacteria)]|uniref:amidohydrolase n=1 Tax=unclassified Rhodococcus (in: high G+C Gram-positive bacteria) TaxID=192944 RepID=UPI00163ACAA6|nr:MULTISPECIES: amidohydrolase [unclassified Rhodococcus (in: high G+C Gram-positive bacteria)]MBC2638787.1 amidohydrolase [Rhodococcus sp. 3A]MBC2896472.1 amidohydrolase [Rhodococcus sp. 4CII]